MIKIAVCDDEKAFLDMVGDIIEDEFKDYDVDYAIDLFENITNLLSRTDLLEYDVLFLDIELGETNGVVEAGKIRELGYQGEIVFVTSFAQYSLQGYKVNAFRYILKSNLENEFKECIKSLVDKLLGRIVVISGQPIKLSDVMYVSSKDHTITFNMVDDNNYVVYSKLDSIAKIVGELDFVRVHQSYLVNIKYISDIERYKITLQNKTQIPVAKPRFTKTVLRIEKWRLLWGADY